MKMLKRLLSFSRLSFWRRPWAVHSTPQNEPTQYSPVASDEFARLLMSRRPEDLKILARKLSAPAKVKI